MTKDAEEMAEDFLKQSRESGFGDYTEDQLTEFRKIANGRVSDALIATFDALMAAGVKDQAQAGIMVLSTLMIDTTQYAVALGTSRKALFTAISVCFDQAERALQIEAMEALAEKLERERHERQAGG